MTLVLTAVGPWGIWQSTDNDVTSAATNAAIDRNWAKQVVVSCADAYALLGYSGLARTPSGESLARWICRQVAPLGELRDFRDGISTGSAIISLDDSMSSVADRANIDFSQSPYRDYRNQPLTIIGAAYTAEGPVRLEVTNVRLDGTCAGQFRYERTPLLEAQVIGHGSGAHYVLPAERERLANIIGRKPRRPEDYLGLLARQNRIVALRMPSGVSPWSQATHIDPTGTILGGIFHPLDDRPGRIVRPTRLVFGGVDMTPAMEELARRNPRHHGTRQWTYTPWSVRSVSGSRPDARGPRSS